MKASHDSLTAYRLRSWWFYPLLWMARTQSKTIERQFEVGVRYFDLRFRNVGGKLYGAHGLMIFDITAEEVFAKLSKCKDDVYFRVLLEDAILIDDISIADFKHEIDDILIHYDSPNLHLHCIGRKSKWSELELCTSISFYGSNRWKLSDYKRKIDEMQNIEMQDEPSIYECYTYKGFPFPRLSAWLIRKFVPENSMSNFV